MQKPSSNILTDIQELLTSVPIILSGSTNNYPVPSPSLPQGTLNPSVSTIIPLPFHVQSSSSSTVDTVKRTIVPSFETMKNDQHEPSKNHSVTKPTLIDRIIKDATVGLTDASVGMASTVELPLSSTHRRNPQQTFPSFPSSTNTMNDDSETLASTFLPPVSFVSPSATINSNESLMNITDVEDNTSSSSSGSSSTPPEETVNFQLTRSTLQSIPTLSSIAKSPLELEAQELLQNEEYVRQQIGTSVKTDSSSFSSSSVSTSSSSTSLITKSLPSTVIQSIQSDPFLGFLRTSLSTSKNVPMMDPFLGNEETLPSPTNTSTAKPLNERARLLLKDIPPNQLLTETANSTLTPKDVRKINDWERKGTKEVIHDWNQDLRGYERLPQPTLPLSTTKAKNSRPVRLAYSLASSSSRSKSVPPSKPAAAIATVAAASVPSLTTDSATSPNQNQPPPPSSSSLSKTTDATDHNVDTEQPLPSFSSLSVPWTGNEVAELRHRLRLLKSRFSKRTTASAMKPLADEPTIDRLPRPSVHQLFPKEYLLARRSRSHEPMSERTQNHHDNLNGTVRTSFVSLTRTTRIPHPPSTGNVDASLLPQISSNADENKDHPYLVPELHSSLHQHMVHVYNQPHPPSTLPGHGTVPHSSSSLDTTGTLVPRTVLPPSPTVTMTPQQAKDLFALHKLSLTNLVDNHTRQRWNQECTPQALCTLLSSPSIADTLEENLIALPSTEYLLRWFHLTEQSSLPPLAVAVIMLRKVSEDFTTIPYRSLQAVRILYRTERERIIRTRIEALNERRTQIRYEISVQETLSRTGLSNFHNLLTLVNAANFSSPPVVHSKDDNDKYGTGTNRTVATHRRNSYSSSGPSNVPAVLYQAAQRGEGSPYRLALLYDLLAQITAKIPFEMMKTSLLLRKTFDQYLKERETLLAYHRSRLFLARILVQQCISRIRVSVARNTFVLKRRNFLRRIQRDWQVSALERSGERGREVIAGQLVPVRLREKYFRYLRSNARAQKANKTYTSAVSLWKQSYCIAEVFQGWKLYVKRIRAIHGRMDSFLRTEKPSGPTNAIMLGTTTTNEAVPYGLRPSPSLVANLHTLRRDSVTNEIRSVTESLTQQLYSSSAASSSSSSSSTGPPHSDTSPRIALLARQYALRTRSRMNLRKFVVQYIHTARSLLSLAVSDLLMSYQINGGWTFALSSCLNHCIRRGIPKISVAPIYGQLTNAYRSQRMVEAIGLPLRTLGYEIYNRDNHSSMETETELRIERIDPLAVGLALHRSLVCTPPSAKGIQEGEEEDDSFHSTPSPYALQLWSRIPWSLLGVSVDDDNADEEGNEGINTLRILVAPGALRTTPFPSSSVLPPVADFSALRSRYVDDTLTTTSYPGHMWTKYLSSSIATAPMITAVVDTFQPMVGRPTASPFPPYAIPPSLLNSRAPTPRVPVSNEEVPSIPVPDTTETVIEPPSSEPLVIESTTLPALPPLPSSRPSSRLSLPLIPTSAASSRRNSEQPILQRPSSRLSNLSTTSSFTHRNPVAAAAYTDLLQRATLIANRKLLKRMFAVWIHRSRLWNLKKRIIALWRYRRQREAMDAWKRFTQYRWDTYARCATIGKRLRQRQAFLTWESNVRNRVQYYETQIVRFRYTTQARNVFTRLRCNVQINHHERTQTAKADSFYRQWLQRKAYVRWKLLSLAHKPYRLFTKYVQHRQSVRAARPLWLKWRVFTENRQLLRRVFLIGTETRRLQIAAEANRHEHNFRLLCNVLSAWKDYAHREKVQRHDLALQYTAEASYRHRTLYRTFQGWKTFHQLQRKVQEFRQRFMDRRKIYYLRYWAQLHMRRQASLLRLYWRWQVQQPLLRSVRYWRKVTEVVRLRNHDTVQRMFRYWKEHAVLNYHPLRTIVNERYAVARRKRMFRAWKQFAVRSVYVKDVVAYCNDERIRRQRSQVLRKWLANAKQQRANRLFITPPYIESATVTTDRKVVAVIGNADTDEEKGSDARSQLPHINHPLPDSFDLTEDLEEPPVPVLVTISPVVREVLTTIHHESTQISLPSVPSPSSSPEPHPSSPVRNAGTNTTRIMTVMVQTDNTYSEASLLSSSSSSVHPYGIDAGTSMSQDHSTLSSISADSLDRLDFLTPSYRTKQQGKMKDPSRKPFSSSSMFPTSSSTVEKGLITVRDDTLEGELAPDHDDSLACPIVSEASVAFTVNEASALTGLSSSTTMDQSQQQMEHDSVSGILNASAALLSRPGTAMEERIHRGVTPMDTTHETNEVDSTVHRTPATLVQRPASALTAVHDDTHSLHPEETSSPSHPYHSHYRHTPGSRHSSPESKSSPLSVALTDASMDSFVSVHRRTDEFSVHTPVSTTEVSRRSTTEMATIGLPVPLTVPSSSLPFPTASPPKLSDSFPSASSSSVVIVTIGSPVDSLYQSSIENRSIPLTEPSIDDETEQETSPVPERVLVQRTDAGTSPIVIPHDSSPAVVEPVVGDQESTEPSIDNEDLETGTDDSSTTSTVDNYLVNAPVIVINVGNSPLDSLQNYSPNTDTTTSNDDNPHSRRILSNVSMGIQTSPFSQPQFSPEVLPPSMIHPNDDSLSISHSPSSTIRNFLSPSSPIPSTVLSSVSSTTNLYPHTTATTMGPEFMIVTIGSPTDSLQNLSSATTMMVFEDTNIHTGSKERRSHSPSPVTVPLLPTPSSSPPPPETLPPVLPQPVITAPLQEPHWEECTTSRKGTSNQTSPVTVSSSFVPTPPKDNTIVPSQPAIILENSLLPEEVNVQEHFIYIPIGSPSDSLEGSIQTNTSIPLSDIRHRHSFEQEMKDELSIDMDRSKPSIRSSLSFAASLSSSMVSFTQNLSDESSVTTVVSSSSLPSSSTTNVSNSIENASMNIHDLTDLRSDNVVVVTVGSPTDSLKEGKGRVTTEVQTSPLDNRSIHDNSTESSISIDDPYRYLTIGSPTDSLRDDSSPVVRLPPPKVPPVVPKYTAAAIQTSPPPPSSSPVVVTPSPVVVTERIKPITPKPVNDKVNMIVSERASLPSFTKPSHGKHNENEFTVVVVGSPTDSLNETSIDTRPLTHRSIPFPSPITSPSVERGNNDNMYIAIGETDSLNGDKYRRSPKPSLPVPSRYYAGETDSIEGDGSRRYRDENDTSHGSSTYSVDPLMYIQSFNDNDSLVSQDRSHTGHSPLPKEDSIDNTVNGTIETPPVVPPIRKTTVVMVNRANQGSTKVNAASTTTTTNVIPGSDGTKDNRDAKRSEKTKMTKGTVDKPDAKPATAKSIVPSSKGGKGNVHRPPVVSSTAGENSLLLTSTFVTTTTTTTTTNAVDESIIDRPTASTNNILPLSTTLLMDITEETHETKDTEKRTTVEEVITGTEETNVRTETVVETVAEKMNEEDGEENDEQEEESIPVLRAQQKSALRVRSRSRNRGRKLLHPSTKIVPQLRTASPANITTSEPLTETLPNFAEVLSSTTNDIVELLNGTLPAPTTTTNLPSSTTTTTITVSDELSRPPASSLSTWKPKPVPSSIVDKPPIDKSSPTRTRYTKALATKENVYECVSSSNEKISLPQIERPNRRIVTNSTVSPRSAKTLNTGTRVTDERIPVIKSSTLPESYLAPPLSLSLPNPVPLPADFDVTNFTVPEGYTAMFVTASQLPLPIAVANDVDPAEPVAILVPNSDIDTVIEKEEGINRWSFLRPPDTVPKNISASSKQLLHEIKALTKKE